MTPAVRFKAAVRKAIARCGGIEGAAATVEKSTAHVGRWNARNEADLPTLGDAFAIDEVAVIDGARPEILHRYAAELGFVAIRLPDCAGGEDALTRALAEAAAEFGDVARTVCDALANGVIDEGEPEAIVEQIDEAQAALARMRARLVPPVAPDAVRVVVKREGER